MTPDALCLHIVLLPIAVCIWLCAPVCESFLLKESPGEPPKSRAPHSAALVHTLARQTRGSPVGRSQAAICPGPGAGEAAGLVRLWPRRPTLCNLQRAALCKPGCQQMRPPQEGQGRGRAGGGRLHRLEAVPEGLVWSPIRGSFIHISLPRRSNKKYLVFWPPASQRRAGSMPLNA